MSLRVLVVIDSFSFGGAENLLAVLAAAAPGAGLELQVASLAPRSQGRTSLLPILEQAGLPISFLDVPRLADPLAVPKIARVVRESGCDIVHAHLGYSATLAPIAARLAERPSVSTLHHVAADLPVRERLKEWLSVAIPGRLGNLVLVSEAARAEFARRYVQRSSWRVIHNGVDLSAFAPGDDTLPSDVPIPAGAPVVTVVAALRDDKGHATAINAWPGVVAAHPTARLLIVGDGPERHRLEQLARDRGLAQRVVFAGTRHDVPRLLRASTLAALPSDDEALPTALIEAAACGRAVVATRVGGVPEVVEDGHTGLLVPPGDPEEFATAVNHLLQHDTYRESMQAAARRLAEERFDMNRWARRLVDLYTEALRGYDEAPGPRRHVGRRDAGVLPRVETFSGEWHD